MINKVDEGVLIDLCEQFNKVILEVLGFYGEFRYREGESDDYYIIKINWLEKIIKNESPDVYVFESPYIKFFKPEKMKEATFRIEGESNE